MTDATLAQISALLSAQPAVRDVAVVPDGPALLCYLVLDPAAGRAEAVRLGAAREQDWRFVFESIYDTDPVPDEEVDVTAFSSAYTRQPFSSGDMLAWAEATEAQVRPRLPERPRIIEIGCGTGLTLRRLAPGCDRYAVVDFSAAALDRLRRSLRGPEFAHVEYHHAAADDLPGRLRDFDAVVIAQVAQYFPSEEYLRRVLTGALARIRPSGFVYLDVRSLPLLETFHVSLELLNAAGGPPEPAATILARARRRVLSEDELVVHPALFESVAADAGVWAQTLARRGRRTKELTAYRYDAFLWPSRPDEEAPPAHWLTWDDDWDLGRVRETLSTRRGPAPALTGIPHAMLTEDLAAHRRLAAGTGDPVTRAWGGAAVLPDDLYELAAETGHHLRLGCAGEAGGGAMDLWTAHSPDAPPPPPPPSPRAVGAPGHRGPLTNDPSRREARQKVVRRIGELLRATLPARRPVTVVPLERLPRTPAGEPDIPSLRAAAQISGHPGPAG